MKRIIHHLRRQSEENRRHILNIVIVILAVFLFLLWIFSFGNSREMVQTKKSNEDLNIFSSLKVNLIEGYKSITE